MSQSKLAKVFHFMDTLGLGERDPFGNPIEVKGFASLDTVYAS